MLSLVYNNFHLYISAICTTLLLLFISSMLGLILAIIFSYFSVKKTPIVYQCIKVYLFIIRGTPFLLQLFIIYYGMISLHIVKYSFLSIIFKSAYNCTILALVINTSAYITIFLTHAIKNSDQQQISAAYQLGLSKFQTMKHIIIPKVLVEALPVYKNELIMLLKCTAITSSITLLDIMGATQQIIEMTYQTIPSLIIAALLYLMINLAISVPIKLSYNRHLKKY